MSPSRISAGQLSFLTPYWSGSEMMRIHLESIRRFHPDAAILVSKRGGGREEMEAYRREFGIRYWLENCEYPDAFFRLLKRCDTDHVCVLDHDVILLSGLDPLLTGLMQARYDLVGIEERIRVPDAIWQRHWPACGGWLRFAPGYMDATFLMFNLREFVRRWRLRGMMSRQSIAGASHEFHYGICEKLKRHRYLLPFHARKYGMGNLLKDGDTALLWHQWFGAYRTRLTGTDPAPDDTEPADSTVLPVAENGERAFIADYPNFDFSGLEPAWGPDFDIEAEQLAIARRHRAGAGQSMTRGVQRLRLWWHYGMRGIATRGLAKLDRWWRLR